MIGVIVRHEDRVNLVAVGMGDCQDLKRRVCRIHHDATSSRRIADEVREIAHLDGNLIASGKISPSEKLSEVQVLSLPRHDRRLGARTMDS